MNLYQNKYILITLDEENSLIQMKWFPITHEADDDDFKAWNQELVRQVEKHKPSRMLADTKAYNFTITPTLQEWSVGHVFEPFAVAGVRKLALVMPVEIFPQVSLEQFVDEYKGGKIENHYFDNLEDAKKWLLQ